MIEAITAFKRGISALEAQVPLTGSEWANKHFYLSPESSGTEGDWECYPYQVAWLNWMTSDDIEEVNFQKSRRVGYTKCLMAGTGCLIEQKNRNIAIWQPTDGDAKDFVTDEIDTMLRDVPALGDKLKCQVGAKSKHNTIEKKSFVGATLDIRGGKSARNFRRMTKDVAIYDETDGFDIDIDGEGSCFELGDGRLDQAPFPKSIRGSTPKTKGMSLIEKAVGASDMVFWRFVTCPHCGERQRLEFSGLRWDGGNPETAHYQCKSGCRIEYRDYPDMDAGGRWQTDDGYYYEEESDRFFDPSGNPIQKPRRIGVRIWAAYSYLRPWSYIADKWIQASRVAKTGDKTLLKTVTNTLLGETYEDEAMRVDPADLVKRYAGMDDQYEIPDDVLFATWGADVQHDRIEVEVVGWGAGEQSWSLEYEIINGSPANPRTWRKFEEFLARKWTTAGGRAVDVPIGGIDTGDGQTQDSVYAWVRPKMGNRRGALPFKGSSTFDAPIWTSPSKPKKGEGDKLYPYLIGVSQAKMIIYERLAISEPGPGFMNFPPHYDDKYFSGLTAEELVTKLNKGFPRKEWHLPDGKRNEPLDCRVYAFAAMKILNPNFEALAAKYAVDVSNVAKIANPEPKRSTRRRKVVRKMKMRGF